MCLQEYKGKRLVAVDSPGEDVEEETAEEEDTKAADEKQGKPKLVGEQQTELASFVKVPHCTHMRACKPFDYACIPKQLLTHVEARDFRGNLRRPSSPSAAGIWPIGSSC